MQAIDPILVVLIQDQQVLVATVAIVIIIRSIGIALLMDAVSITLHLAVRTERAVSVHAFLMTPQAPSWQIQDPSRSGVCNALPLKIQAPSASTGLCPRGSTLAIQLCGTSGSTYHYEAHWHCDDGTSGLISGDFTIDS